MKRIVESGLLYTPRGLGFDRSFGEVFEQSSTPTLTRFSSQCPVAFHLFFVISGTTIWFNTQEKIESDKWCDGRNGIKIVPEDHWTVQPVILNMIDGGTLIGSGKKVYSCKDAALRGMLTLEDPTTKEDAWNLRGWLAVKQGATTLVDKRQAVFANVNTGINAVLESSEDLSREDLIYYIKDNQEFLRQSISKILEDSKSPEEAADLALDYLTQCVPISLQGQFQTRAHTVVLQDFLGRDYISISYDLENLFEA